MYVEATSQTVGDTASLLKPLFYPELHEPEICWKFYYHMYGADVDTLVVRVCLEAAIASHLENKRWDVLFCPIFNRVIMDGHPNILSGECRRSRCPPQLKYWMPIHYDTIEDGAKQNIPSFILILS